MRINRVRFALSGGAALAAGLVAAGAALADPAGSSHNGFQNPASPVASQISGLFWIITIIAAVVGTVVEILLYVSIRKFRADRPGGEEGGDGPSSHLTDKMVREHAAAERRGGDPRLHRVENDNPKLEIMIFIGTAAAFAALVLVSLNTLWAIETPPDDPNTVNVTVIGSQWAWEFRYPEQGVTELSALSEMHVPVNTVVRLSIESRDVIHAVWIPDLGVKVDAVPGHTNRFWFNAEREGRYLLQCAEFCGGAHSDMHASVVVESRAAFEAWVDQKLHPPPPPAPPILTGDVVDVTLADFSISFARTLNIERTATATFRITNSGTMPHGLHFEGPNDQTSPLVAAGATVLWNATFANDASNAVVSCPVAGHAGAGMTSTYNVSQGPRVIDVRLHDSGVPGSTFSISPSLITLTAGEKVSFRVINDGSVPHNLMLGEPYNVVSDTIGPGQTTLMAPITAVADADHYWCAIVGHREQGMEGSFGGGGVSGPSVPGFEGAFAAVGLSIAAVAVARRRRVT